MRFAILVAAFSLVSMAVQAGNAATDQITACGQANSDLERHDLGCRDEDMYIVMPDNDAND